MSVALILVIVVGGTPLVAAAVAWSVVDELFSPAGVFARPPEAFEAREIVSGTHRGRPFEFTFPRSVWT
ncbi:hypothetical protein ACQPXB_10690 [Amycolatopsis sp. CA-161197]|uniref:hypothetical protein n=1 Tax=unclassified Amycolatopsis TaxID=2618356 RepID=UPI003455DA4C